MKGIITHKIRIGDSLQKLARLYDVRDWRSIAEINELEPPYIDSVYDSTEHKDNPYVACVGDTIVIPSAKAYVLSTRSKDEIENESYGRDLDLYDDKPVEQIVKGELRGSRDINVVSGIANLAQQLMTLLTVKKGGLLLHPEFGSNLHLYTGHRDSIATRNKIRFETESCLRSDFRVQDVQDVEVEKDGDAYFVTARIIPIPPHSEFNFEYKLKR